MCPGFDNECCGFRELWGRHGWRTPGLRTWPTGGLAAARQTGNVQTFLPYADFERSARTLDLKRLGKQRVETIQVVRALTRPDYGWASHPAVLMWRGFEEALGRYGFTCCEVWVELGFGDTCALTIATDLRAAGIDAVRTQRELAAADALPPWLGDEAVHRSHRSALVRKDPGRYRPMFPDIPDDLPYVWPVRSATVIAAEQRRAENEVRRQLRALERSRLEAERVRRKRSRAAKKAWQTRRRSSAPPTGAGSDTANDG
jgi:pyrimidine dimer DNA glycosylase